MTLTRKMSERCRIEDAILKSLKYQFPLKQLLMIHSTHFIQFVKLVARHQMIVLLRIVNYPMIDHIKSYSIYRGLRNNLLILNLNIFNYNILRYFNI